MIIAEVVLLPVCGVESRTTVSIRRATVSRRDEAPARREVEQSPRAPAASVNYGSAFSTKLYRARLLSGKTVRPTRRRRLYRESGVVGIANALAVGLRGGCCYSRLLRCISGR